MKIVQAIKEPNKPFKLNNSVALKEPLVLVFGNRYLLESDQIYAEVREMFPNGHIVFGTTSGEIIDNTVLDNCVVLTAIEFEKSSILVKRSNVDDFNNDDEKLGKSLM
ncbi:MAG: FIST N-terminal domain-containing protein, partial [Maribacter stanieri]